MNSQENSQRNIARHYDLSNELFEQFLDETMSYSSAWFEPGDDLATAQLRKIDGVLDLARVRTGMHVLEIGSGWGALAIRAAAERGARVTTLTLSTEQQALARKRAEAAGVGDLVEVRLQDYRDARGQFDAIVSVEMIEAVGEAYWPTYFRALDDLLAPGGRVGLQVDHHVPRPHAGHPARLQLDPQVRVPRRDHPLRPGDLGEPHRAHRARHPGAPRPRPALRAHPGAVAGEFPRQLVAPGGFLRRHLPADVEFYLAYCEAGFRSGYLGVSQLGLARSPFGAGFGSPRGSLLSPRAGH